MGSKISSTLGNSLRVSVCINANSYSQANVTTTTANTASGSTTIVVASASNLIAGDIVTFANHTTEYEITGISTNTLTIREKGKTTGLTTGVDGSSSAVQVSVKCFYADDFDAAPETSAQATARGGANDEIHVVVVDEDGLWSGTAGTILEKYANLSVASDAKKSDGTVNFYKEYINEYSEYIWWGDHHTDLDSDVSAVASLLNNTFSHTSRKPQYVSLAGGTDDNAPTDANFKLHFLNLQMTKSLMFH